MTIYENIKKLSKEIKGISITALEAELGYGNGSLAKAKDIPSSRIFEISNYLGVSMEYIMTGKKPDIPDISDLSMEQFELMELYGKLKEEQKTAIMNLLRSFTI